MSGSDAFADDGVADRASPPAWPETRAELQARLTEEIEQGKAEVERRRHERLAAEAVERTPDWRRFTSLNQMTHREYSAWLDSGKPTLGPPPSPPPQPAPDLVTTQLRQLAVAVGEMAGEAERELKAELAKLRDEAVARETALRAELLEVRGAIQDVRSELLALREAAAGRGEALAPKPNGKALHA